MENQIKMFNIFKNTKKTKEGQPDYRMNVKIGDNYVECGAGWIKDSKNGKYISCKLNDVYVDHTKGTATQGFVLVQENSNGNDMPPIVEKEEVDESQIPF